MHGAYLFVVWLHILAAAIWIGGMVFFVLVAVPLVRNPEYKGVAPGLVRWMGRRFRTIGWIVLVTLIVTGAFNLWVRGIGLEQLGTAAFWADPFGKTLRHKLELVTLVLVLSATHDFWVGPRATELLKADPTAAKAKSMRAAASWMGRANLLLALAVLAFAVALVRGCA